MIETLKKYNCHFKIINLIKNLYQNQVAALRMENGNTEWFQVKRGVRQGCILSPALFSLYTESIMRDVKAEDTEDKYSAINPITELRYADGTALLSKTTEGLNELMQNVKKFSQNKNLLLNVKKTKVMDSDKSPAASILIDNEALENVTHFNYLGANIEADGKITPDIRKRLAIATF
ncbi:retrovirus-related Pol polyprotein from type-1 retrotransposable element R2 [Elysia marginata]|uniref:Retrovirus-related Pol polyprotein from type-1 retrotransposable element R2 n=1 Tax=Elysia marginata TaxID=1093978 RepID=A0AAV4GPP0_9GAST|nr:retrovirus-related Pol polyprotein from type-1 retrotransposable element R2 [Elysia marginata]